MLSVVQLEGEEVAVALTTDSRLMLHVLGAMAKERQLAHCDVSMYTQSCRFTTILEGQSSIVCRFDGALGLQSSQDDQVAPPRSWLPLLPPPSFQSAMPSWGRRARCGQGQRSGLSITPG